MTSLATPVRPPAARRHPGRWIACGVASVVVALAVVLALNVGTDPTAATRTSSLLGRPAPNFELPTLDGGRVTLAGLAGKSVVGVALKAAPIVGAAIGTAKATIDMFKDPSVENGLKLAANAIGLIPLPGMSAVSMAAAAALENPKVMAATAGAVRSAGKWASGVADRMAANAATMEPLGLAM